MEVHISDEAAATLDELVQLGGYENREQVLEAALVVLRDKELAYTTELNQMVRAARESVAAGGGTPASPGLAQRLIDEARARRSSGGGRRARRLQ